MMTSCDCVGSSRLSAAQFLRTTPSDSTHHVRATLMGNSTDVGPSSVLEACGRDSGHRCHNGAPHPSGAGILFKAGCAARDNCKNATTWRGKT